MGIEVGNWGVRVINGPRPAPPAPMRPIDPEFRVSGPIVTGSAYLGTLVHTIEIHAMNCDTDRLAGRLADILDWARAEAGKPNDRWGWTSPDPLKFPPTGVTGWLRPFQIWFSCREDAFAFVMRWRGVPL